MKLVKFPESFFIINVFTIRFSCNIWQNCNILLAYVILFMKDMVLNTWLINLESLSNNIGNPFTIWYKWFKWKRLYIVLFECLLIAIVLSKCTKMWLLDELWYMYQTFTVYCIICNWSLYTFNTGMPNWKKKWVLRVKLGTDKAKLSFVN